MKRLIFLCIFLFSIAAALPALPASDARFVNIGIRYHLHDDGSWDMEYQHQVRLDTYLAVNRLGETFIVTNPDFQELEILKAETTMADGRKVSAPDNAFNEVLPFAAHGFGDFAQVREMVVTHTGLERGALVDLRYRVHTKPGFLPAFSGREALLRDFPVDRYTLEIVVPAGVQLRHGIFGLTGEMKASVDGTQKTYTFQYSAAKPVAREALAPAFSEPALVFSTAADWSQALALTADAAPLPAALAAKVERLNAQFPARADLLAALQKFVAVEVQNCGLGCDATGWQPRPLARVFASNYATRLEKGLLLRALLEHAGFRAGLLGVAPGAGFAADVPTPLQFGEFWLTVSEGPHVSYLDPWREQHEFFPYRCQGLDAWSFERRAAEKFPLSGWEANGIDIAGVVQLDGAAASGTLTVAVRGIFNRYGEAVENSGRFIEGLLKKIFPVQKFEIKKLLQLTRHEVRVEAAFSGPWLKDAGADYFSVDAIRLPGVSENMVQLLKRESPLALEAPFRVTLELGLQPAAGLSLEYRAPDAQVKNEAGHFLRSLRSEKNGSMRFSQSCAIEKNPVTPDLYPRLRELLKANFTPDLWLVLKKEK